MCFQVETEPIRVCFCLGVDVLVDTQRSMHSDIHQRYSKAQSYRFPFCRHIFADRLYVEEYKASDFYREVGLDRQKLIYLALLLGSDYTEGISGIGIVNAVSSIQALKCSLLCVDPHFLVIHCRCENFRMHSHIYGKACSLSWTHCIEPDVRFIRILPQI